jgi:hypothetical protein
MPGVPIKLCAFHVAICWAKNLCEKVSDKASKEAISASLTYLHRLNDLPSGSTRSEIDRRAQQALDEFREKHSSEGPFLEYFMSTYGGKIGELFELNCTCKFSATVRAIKITKCGLSTNA